MQHAHNMHKTSTQHARNMCKTFNVRTQSQQIYTSILIQIILKRQIIATGQLESLFHFPSYSHLLVRSLFNFSAVI